MHKDTLRDIVQWDVGSWSKALLYWENKVDWTQVENGLELGGREGGLSLWLALKGKSMICSDLSEVKATAEALHQRYNVLEYIDYQNIDASNIPYENCFDVIVFKSIIGGIGRNNNVEIQRTVFKQIYKALKPGGRLLFAENLIASPLHQALRKRYVNWGSTWRYLTIAELRSFLKDFSSVEIKATGVLGTFGRNESQRNSLSFIDNLIMNRVCLDQWKYIGYGMAVK
jgi:SAM-dependent methyltransferase